MRDTIGRMRRRLVIEAPSEEPDGAGGVIRTFIDHSTVWAGIEPVSSEFRLANGSTGQTVTHRMTLRAGPQLTAQHRLRDGTRIYRIRSVHTADAENRFLTALTEEMTG